MADRLTLRLDGPFEVFGPDGAALGNLSRRGRALLAYLASQPGHSAPRAVLMELLWSDRSRDQAGASLRQELSRLRRAIPEGVLDADRSDVRLDPDQIRLAGGAGPFLDGFDLASRGFEDWLRDARAERSAHLHDRQAALAEDLLAKGDAKAAERAALSALEAEPASETAMQILLRAAAHGADRAEALARFARFRAYLSERLGIDCLPETAALADALRASAAPRTAPDPPAAIAAPEDRGMPAIAILPFEELGSPDADMFADGVVEEITASLSRARDFHVIARQSTFALQHEPLSHAELGARLGADYLLEGTIRRAGERVRITTRLVLSRSGHVIWSDRQDERLDDLFDLQDRIASHVAGQISPNLRSAEIDRARAKPPRDRNAYDLVLTAYPFFWSHRREDNLRALTLYGEALDCDPAYPLAMAMKAWCHAQQACYTWSKTPAEDRAQAQSLARKAAALESQHAPTLVAACAALSITTVDQTLPKSIIERALALDPNNAWGWLRSGWLHCLHNQPRIALDHFDRAEHLSPLDPFLFNILFGRAKALAELDELARAVELVREGLNMAPGVTWAYRMLAAYCAALGDRAGAEEALGIYRKHYPDMTIRKLQESMAPAIFATNGAYIDGLRKAGIPEE